MATDGGLAFRELMAAGNELNYMLLPHLECLHTFSLVLCCHSFEVSRRGGADEL